MPNKSPNADYMRQWREKNPEKNKLYIQRASALRKKRGTPKKGLGTSHFDNSLGPPEEPTQKHVVLARLLRRLLLEAWNKSYLSKSNTQDDSEFEVRVRAALDVSKCLHVEESTDAQSTEIEGSS